MKLIWLDDLRNPLEKDWADWLLKYSPIEHPYEVIWVKSYGVFVHWITVNGLPDGFSFDHDLGEDIARDLREGGMSKKEARKQKKLSKSGMDCAKWLVEYCLDNNLKLPPYSIQSANTVGRENIDGLLKSFNKNVTQS